MPRSYDLPSNVWIWCLVMVVVGRQLCPNPHPRPAVCEALRPARSSQAPRASTRSGMYNLLA
jgi:hypothetical protein